MILELSTGQFEPVRGVRSPPTQWWIAEANSSVPGAIRRGGLQQRAPIALTGSIASLTSIPLLYIVKYPIIRVTTYGLYLPSVSTSVFCK